jgi:hypothetical protein
MSKEEEERTIPVKPPTTNKKINPNNHKKGTDIFKSENIKVLTQLNTLTPVGIAITIVAAVKYARVSTSIPTVYI